MKSNLTPTRYSTRTGKIARLPQTIRQQLNERLADGEPHQYLVAWLNGNSSVQHRLIEFFDGRPITEQNLSDWRQGGFLDWQRHQESRGLVREFLCESEEVEEEVGESALLDRLTGSVTVVLLRLFREVAAAESGPEQRQAVLEIARELARLRRGDHQRQRVRILEEQLRRQRPSERDLELIQRAEMEEKYQQVQRKHVLRREAFREEYIAGRENGTLTPERQEWIEQYFDELGEELESYSIDPEEPDDEEVEEMEPVAPPRKSVKRRKKSTKKKAKRCKARKASAPKKVTPEIATAMETKASNENENAHEPAPSPASPSYPESTPSTESPAATAELTLQNDPE